MKLFLQSRKRAKYDRKANWINNLYQVERPLEGTSIIYKKTAIELQLIHTVNNSKTHYVNLFKGEELQTELSFFFCKFGRQKFFVERPNSDIGGNSLKDSIGYLRDIL